MKNVVFTPEQREKLKGVCLISDVTMIALGEPSEITRENFKAFWINDEDELVELTVDDFSWYDPKNEDKDFKFTEDNEYVIRESVPNEVLKLLDAVIEERMTKEE